MGAKVSELSGDGGEGGPAHSHQNRHNCLADCLSGMRVGVALSARRWFCSCSVVYPTADDQLHISYSGKVQPSIHRLRRFRMAEVVRSPRDCPPVALGVVICCYPYTSLNTFSIGNFAAVHTWA